MARGVGKALVAAAKLLSNPVGAVASVFRKKGLKRGPTAASAGLVRRRYKKRSTGFVRSKQVNDGQGNVRIAKSIGHQPRRLKHSLETKIRDMLNPANHHLVQESGNVNIQNSKSVYAHYEMMNAGDVDDVILQSGNSGSENKYNGKLNIQNARLQLTIRNQTTNLLNFRIYEYICRRDVPDKVETFPGSGVELDGTTQNIITVGFQYQKVHQIDSTSVGGTLFQNPMFCTYYKITKVRSVQLGAGKCMNLDMSMLRSRIINPLVYNASDGDVLAGLTRGFVIQASGSLVGPEGHGTPTTGFVNYDWFCSRKYAYNQPYFSLAKNTITTTLPDPISPQYHINEYTGQAQVQADA